MKRVNAIDDAGGFPSYNGSDRHSPPFVRQVGADRTSPPVVPPRGRNFESYLRQYMR